MYNDKKQLKMGEFNYKKYLKKGRLTEEKISQKDLDFEKAKEEERLANHPEKDKIKDIRAMMDRERSLKENMSPGEAVVELNYYMDKLQEISGEVSEIMAQYFPDEFNQGEAYGAFDFGSSSNRFNTTFESILDDLASTGDDEDMMQEDLDLGHQDDEPGMIKAELYHIGTYAMELYSMMNSLEGIGEVDFPAWWQSKITTSKNMISGAKHYLEFELKETGIDTLVNDTIKKVKEAHLGNPLNEEDRATRVDKMMSGEYDDEDYKDSKRYDDVRADLDEEIDDEDIVIYDGEEHIIMSRDGNMIYIRPLEDSAILGKRDVIKVPARALAYKSDLDKMYDEYKPKDELDEDMNDPVLMKARAAKMADEKEMARQAALDKKYGSSFMDKLDAEIDLKNELQDLKDEREQLMIDMEQEAEPEGGEIADDYGSRLNDIDSRMAEIKSELEDLRMYESVNEKSLELDVTDSGNPETIGDESIERESASPAFESKLTRIYKSIKK